VALGVRPGELWRELALVDEILDDRVVDADLRERAGHPAVHAGVADVEHEPVGTVGVLRNRNARDRRAACPALERLMDPRGGALEARVHVVGRRGGPAGELRELLDSETARDVAGVVTAHPVRDEEHRWVGEQGVLVHGADETSVRCRSPRRPHSSPPTPAGTALRPR
jgi:hypothetical protein